MLTDSKNSFNTVKPLKVDNPLKWISLACSVEESIRMTEDRDKWRKYVHAVANPRIEDG